MSSLRSYYDRRARAWLLNGAIVYIVCFAIYGCLGVFQVFKYFQHLDPFYLYVAPFNILLGIVSVLHGVNVIHAILRRKVDPATAAVPSSPPTGN